MRGYGVFFLLKRDERSMDVSKLLKMAGSLPNMSNNSRFCVTLSISEARVLEVALKLYKARP